MQVNIRRAMLNDVYDLAPRLRQEDKDEFWASHHIAARDALLVSFLSSQESWVAAEDSAVIAMFGVSPVPDGGLPWFLGSDRVNSLPVTFYRRSKVYVRGMLEKYGYLMNDVDARNLLSIAWLKWLGFTMEEPVPYGVDGLPFHRFWMRRGEDVYRGGSRSS